MKNSQKGFIIPLLIITIAALVVGGGLYVNNQNKRNIEETIAPDVSTQKHEEDLVKKNDNNPLPSNISTTQIPSVTKTLSVTEFNQNSIKNSFQTFGDVLYKNGEYFITEKANAGIFATVDIPPYSLLTFKFKFTKEGDGDFLSVYTNQDFNGKPVQQEIYIGLNNEISRDGYTEQEVDLLLPGKTQIVFNQISRGNANSVLVIKDIKIDSYADEVNAVSTVQTSKQQFGQDYAGVQTAAAVVQLELIPQSDLYYNAHGSYAGFCASSEYKSKIYNFPSSVSLKCLDGESNFAIEFSYKYNMSSFNFCIDSIDGEMKENKKIESISNGYVCTR
jgi:hypothetical protein